MARIKLPKEPKEPKPPREPKQPKEPKPPKPPKEPKQLKSPKVPKEPKQPKEPKTPKDPKQPKVPKSPKEPKPPKQPKEPKQPKKPKVPKVAKEPKPPKVLKEPKQPPKIRIKATILKKTPIVAKKVAPPNGEKSKKRIATATKKPLPSESSRVYEDVKTDEDDLVGDSCTEETMFDVKLTDIANIVIGDLKQVRVNETPFNLDPAQLSVVYSTAEVSKSDCENVEEHENSTAVSWVQEKLDDKCVDIEIVDGSIEEVDGVIVEDDENIGEGEEVIEVYEVSQCYPTVADTVSEEIVINGDCDMKSPKVEHAETEFENLSANSVDTKLSAELSADSIDEDIELSLDDNKVEINDENGCEMVTLPSTETEKMDCDAADRIDSSASAEDSTYTSVNESECPTEELSKLDISEVPLDSGLPAPSTAVESVSSAAQKAEICVEKYMYNDEKMVHNEELVYNEENTVLSDESVVHNEEVGHDTEDVVISDQNVVHKAELVHNDENTVPGDENVMHDEEVRRDAENMVLSNKNVVHNEEVGHDSENIVISDQNVVHNAELVHNDENIVPIDENVVHNEEVVHDDEISAPSNENVVHHEEMVLDEENNENAVRYDDKMMSNDEEAVRDAFEKRSPPTSETVTEQKSVEYVSDLENKILLDEVVDEDDDEMSADDDASGNPTDDDFIVLDDSEIPSSEAKMHQLAAIACSNAYRLPLMKPTPPADEDAQPTEHTPSSNMTEQPPERMASSDSSMLPPELASLSDESTHATANTFRQPPHLSPSLPQSEYEASSESERSGARAAKSGATAQNDVGSAALATASSSRETASVSSKKTANKNNVAAKRMPKETTKSKKSSFSSQEQSKPLKKRGPKERKKSSGEGGNNNKSKESSSKKKSSKDDSTTEEDSPVKNSEKRRRSKRIKSKPEYIEKKEEVKLLAALKGGKEKSGQENDAKHENDAAGGGLTSNGESVPKKLENLVRVAESTDMPPFQLIVDNEYHTERSFSKDAERMICDCTLTKEEIIRGERGCGEDCLNRLLLIECCSRCTLGERCTNKRFQKKQYTKCEAYKTQKKGYGLRVLENVPSGTFLMEYVGEVIDSDEFEDRAVKYAREKIPHFYFMSLKSDCIIDATIKGNYSRFINHSCEPNAETQKWTVQGELRVGFFSKREISAGEEVTFDYQLQRYGKQAQRCYCEASSCTGWIGDDPDKQVEDFTRKERKNKKKRDEYVDWETALEEISQVGLINRHQTLNLNRLMVHAKELPIRMQILQLIEEGQPACRRLFVDYHGLPIIWSWMVDCGPEHDELRIQLLKTLMALPITNKTILIDSKVFSLVEQWAFAVEQKIQSEVLSAQSVLESVEDIASAEETPVSELAQKVLNQWSTLREAYRIPKKERIQQMKEHEREADQNVVKPRPRRLPLYAEKMRDSYQRNRHNRSKDFEKIYFDRLKDRRKRDSPERGRDHHRKTDNAGNKISRMEHRYMFEMKIREKEERKREEELMKRKWETEDPQAYWMQQNANMFYGTQQHPMVPGQFIASVPPPNFTPDASNMMGVPPNMMPNMPAHQTPRSHSHSYYNPPSTFVSPNVMMTHLPPPPTPSPLSSQPSSMANMLPSQQTYYQNSFTSSTPSPLPVPYPHHALSELAAAVTSTAIHTSSAHHHRADMAEQESMPYAYDYNSQQHSLHALHTPVDEIPIPSDDQTTSATYADSQHSYEYEKSSNSSIVTTSALEQQQQQQLLQQLQQQQLQEQQQQLQEQQQQLQEQQEQEEQAQQEQLPQCSAEELIAAVAAVDVSKLKLPPKWKAARDAQGCIYYYHTKTRVSQWYPPTWEEPAAAAAAAVVVEQVEEGDYSSEEESSGEDDDEVVETTKKRRRSSKYDHVNAFAKRLHRDGGGDKDAEQSSFDMDAELRENLAAMSSEFQDSDNEDYSPVTKDIEEGKRDLSDHEPATNANSPPTTVPLITEHIISPREPIDEKERIRNKRRIKMLKEKFRRQKKQKMLESMNGENAGLMDGSNGVNLGDSISSNSSNKLLSVPADTSNLTDRKRKDMFRSNMANFVVSCLNPYFRRGCTAGRITNGEDFKHLARKLTHFVMLKELKHCRNATDLTCNASVKHKAKEYIRKYMSKFGEIYVRPPDEGNF